MANHGNGNNNGNNNGFVIPVVVNNNGNGNNGNGNNGNGNNGNGNNGNGNNRNGNGNDSNLKLKVPTETPDELVIPKDKVARIKRYFGIIRDLSTTNNFTTSLFNNNGNLHLPRNLFEALTDEQFRLFAMLVTMEIESNENHDELYAYLNNVFSILEQTGRTTDELLTIDNALRNFTYQSMAMIDVYDEDSEDPFIHLFEKLLNLSNDPTIIAKSVKFYVLNEHYRNWWNEPTLKQSLQNIVYQIQEIGFDTLKPVADYVRLGDIQEGGRRKRRTRKNRKQK